MKNSELREKLRRRKYDLNSSFDFTKSNIEKITMVNRILLKKSHELFDNMLKVKNDLDKLIASGSAIYRGYSLDGSISIEPYENDFDIENISIEQSPYTISFSENDDCTPDRISILSDGDNWDIETFEPLRKYSIHVCYATHWFFSDGLFALGDMMKLSEDNIQTFMGISI